MASTLSDFHRTCPTPDEPSQVAAGDPEVSRSIYTYSLMVHSGLPETLSPWALSVLVHTLYNIGSFSPRDVGRRQAGRSAQWSGTGDFAQSYFLPLGLELEQMQNAPPVRWLAEPKRVC